jgi:hypothetical protein
MKLLIKHRIKNLFFGTLVQSTLQRGPEDLFQAQGIIPSFIPLPKGITQEDQLAVIKKLQRDKLLSWYLEVFVDEINL